MAERHDKHKPNEKAAAPVGTRPAAASGDGMLRELAARAREAERNAERAAEPKGLLGKWFQTSTG